MYEMHSHDMSNNFKWNAMFTHNIMVILPNSLTKMYTTNQFFCICNMIIYKLKSHSQMD